MVAISFQKFAYKQPKTLSIVSSRFSPKWPSKSEQQQVSLTIQVLTLNLNKTHLFHSHQGLNFTKYATERKGRTALCTCLCRPGYSPGDAMVSRPRWPAAVVEWVWLLSFLPRGLPSHALLSVKSATPYSNNPWPAGSRHNGLKITHQLPWQQQVRPQTSSGAKNTTNISPAWVMDRKGNSSRHLKILGFDFWLICFEIRLGNIGLTTGLQLLLVAWCALT